MGQHRKARAFFFTGVRTAALILVHHQQVVESHFGVNWLCSDHNTESRERGGGKKEIKHEARRVKWSHDGMQQFHTISVWICTQSSSCENREGLLVKLYDFKLRGSALNILWVQLREHRKLQSLLWLFWAIRLCCVLRHMTLAVLTPLLTYAVMNWEARCLRSAGNSHDFHWIPSKADYIS